MYTNEYGNREDPTIILLAPMMVSGENLYEIMSPHFKRQYHFIFPDQGGHGKAGAYISADDKYAQLKKALVKSGHRDIFLVYVASMGSAIGYRLFMDKEFEVKHAWFDGVVLTEKAAFAEWLMKTMFHRQRRKLLKSHIDASPSIVKMYGHDFARMMTHNLERITEADIDHICYACCHYRLRLLSNEEQRKLHLDFGEKDPDLRYAKKSIPKYMPSVKPTIRKGYTHCAYMAAHPAEYVQEIESFIAELS